MRKIMGVVVVLYIVPMMVWWLVLGVYAERGLSFNNSDWGAFGSFFGGVLSPLFSLISILFLYVSIRKSDKNHRAELDVFQAQSRRGQIIKLVEIYNSKLDEQLRQQFSGVIMKCRSSNKVLNLYTGDSTQMPFPDGQVRDVIIDFYFSKQASKRHSKEYVGVVSSLIANVELCYCKILDLLLSIKDSEEFESSVDLVEALAEFHSTIGLLEFNLSSMLYNEESPLLERLVSINERTAFGAGVVSRYLRAKELKKADAQI